MVKVLINKEYGGFTLTDFAMKQLGIKYDWDISRTDPRLIALFERYGAAKIAPCAKIVEIPDDVQWTIEEYDGIEWVAEKHRVWS